MKLPIGIVPFLGDIRSFSGVHIVSYSYSAGNPPSLWKLLDHRSASGSQMEGAENPFRVKRGEVPNRLSQLEVFKEQESIRTLESRLEVFHDLVFLVIRMQKRY